MHDFGTGKTFIGEFISKSLISSKALSKIAPVGRTFHDLSVDAFLVLFYINAQRKMTLSSIFTQGIAASLPNRVTFTGTNYMDPSRVHEYRRELSDRIRY